MIRGAGGTPGGVLHFMFGIAMILGGLLLLGSKACFIIQLLV